MPLLRFKQDGFAAVDVQAQPPREMAVDFSFFKMSGTGMKGTKRRTTSDTPMSRSSASTSATESAVSLRHVMDLLVRAHSRSMAEQGKQIYEGCPINYVAE